jgi:hypothetical protein
MLGELKAKCNVTTNRLVVVQFVLNTTFSSSRLCHPERSRRSGVAKDLPLNRPNAKAKLHCQQTGGGLALEILEQTKCGPDQPSGPHGRENADFAFAASGRKFCIRRDLAPKGGGGGRNARATSARLRVLWISPGGSLSSSTGCLCDPQSSMRTSNLHVRCRHSAAQCESAQ